MKIFLIQTIAVFAYVNLWFLYAVLKRRNDVADVAWGIGFILLALIGLICNPTTRMMLITILVLIWGLRLALHIGRRFLRSKEEDHRYQSMRKEWKGSEIYNSWLSVFMIQGFFLFVTSATIITISIFDKGGWERVNAIGIVLWIVGFIFEVVGDSQLKRFVQTNQRAGAIMKTGLWKYSRHPNYFGEALMWWGIWIVSWGAPFFWIGVISPITINALLRFVSGVPMAEKRYDNNMEFLEYKKKTPPMIPNFFIK
jgi:steroid 5-alpha reductase family enzyme